MYIKDLAIAKKLLPYQISHVSKLCDCILLNSCIIDASDTGTGKTYVTLIACIILGFMPFIVCPKSVVINWSRVARELGVKILGISNYEKLKNCKYYNEELTLCECPYIYKGVHESGGKKKVFYTYQFPENVVLIFDEAHRCKNIKPANSRLLTGAKSCSKMYANVKILLLSATISDKVECFKPFGYMFDFFNEMKDYKKWIKEKANIYRSAHEKDSDEQLLLRIIHDNIFNTDKGSRMKISELGELYPKNQVFMQAYTCSNYDEVDEQWKIINTTLKDLKDKEKNSSALAKIIRARQAIEMFKVPIFLDLVEDAIENDFSVAIFVNFTETLKQLSSNLTHLEKNVCEIYGDQDDDERQINIDEFQNNKSKIIICNIRAGGVGISLHDLYGKKRMSLISPTLSGQDLIQALGRIHRAGAKTSALQYVVFCDGTYENDVCEILKKKISTLTAINDLNFDGIDFKLSEIVEDEDVNEKIKEIEIEEDKSIKKNRKYKVAK